MHEEKIIFADKEIPPCPECGQRMLPADENEYTELMTFIGELAFTRKLAFLEIKCVNLNCSWYNKEVSVFRAKVQKKLPRELE